MTKPAEIFDAAYFRHWYGNAKTRAFTKTDKDVRAAFLLSMLRHLKVKAKSVCDLGCGLGHWRAALQAIDPKIKYTGVEYSAHLCEQMGWTQASAADYTPTRSYDLVICQSVLHYLNDKDCARALRNIARYCNGALYLEVVTQKDWRSGVIDKKHTDSNIYRRSGAWYRKQLAKHFVSVGCGVFLARRANIPLLELEEG